MMRSEPCRVLGKDSQTRKAGAKALGWRHTCVYVGGRANEVQMIEKHTTPGFLGPVESPDSQQLALGHRLTMGWDSETAMLMSSSGRVFYGTHGLSQELRST